jgi:hypothetical protein
MVGNLEQDSGVESFALYAELTKSHKWLDKVTLFSFIFRVADPHSFHPDPDPAFQG